MRHRTHRMEARHRCRDKAVPDHPRGHLVLGIVEIYTKRAAEGIAECEHALALDRNMAHAHATIGFGKIFIGRPEETEAYIVEALRLSPRDTLAYIWMTYAGTAKNQLGTYELGKVWLQRSIEANRNFPSAHFFLAAALAALGRTRRSAYRGEGGSGDRPLLQHPASPRKLVGDKRRFDISLPAWVPPRSPAPGRSSRTVTGVRSRAAI